MPTPLTWGSVLLFALMPGLAQLEPKATALLQQARAAHGGLALEKLKAAELRYRVSSGGKVFEYHHHLHFAARQVLHQSVGPGGVWGESLIGPGGVASWKWNPSTKQLEELAVYPAQALFPLYFWVTGLRWGSEQRQSVQYVGPQIWQGQTGQVIEVKSQRQSVRLLIGTNGTLLGEEVKSDGRYLYSDFVVQEGIKFPRKAILYKYDKPIAIQEFLSFKVVQNPRPLSLNPKPYPAEPIGWESIRNTQISRKP